MESKVGGFEKKERLCPLRERADLLGKGVENVAERDRLGAVARAVHVQVTCDVEDRLGLL